VSSTNEEEQLSHRSEEEIDFKQTIMQGMKEYYVLN
jgi:hypothetical protein